MRTKKKNSSPLRNFRATWTRSAIYQLSACNFDEACEKALADRTLYTPQTLEKLTIRELLKKGNT